MMKLSSEEKQHYLDLYNEEKYLFDVIGPNARKRGYLTFEEFYLICMWKSRRQKKNYLKNKKEVEPVTKAAFREADEAERIKILDNGLKGVGIPTASAVLSVVFPGEYPVADVRCLEMLRGFGIRIKHLESVKNWLYYLDNMRKLAGKNHVTPREIDMILFAMHREKYDKDNYKNLYP